MTFEAGACDEERRRGRRQSRYGERCRTIAESEDDFPRRLSPSEIKSMPAPGEPIATRSRARVRPASEADMGPVSDIYAHYVLNSLATFEETPPTLEEMLARRRVSVDLGLPYLVAEAGGEIVGFTYAAAYRARPAYRFTIEDSVYVAEGMSGRGIGSALLGDLIARCERGPWRQILAVVGDSANAGSIALHRRFGFELVGTLRSVGFKLGRWVDTPVLQRALAAGDGGPGPP
jgi:phosphinothricin acetyltransferase